MRRIGFHTDRKITDIMKSESFTVSAEIIPPRNGLLNDDTMDQIQKLKDAGADFIAVTKGAGGSLRSGSLPIAQIIKEQFDTPCIAHFTCRDLSPAEVENQIMDHHYFGIRNILALRGDPPRDMLDWQPKAGSYHFAHELITQIKNLNQGIYLERNNFEAEGRIKTDFCIGGAAYPEEPDKLKRIGHFKQKAQAGAEYGITQMLYSPDAYAKFVDDLAAEGVFTPIIPGIRILNNVPQAIRLSKRFAFSIPKRMQDELPQSPTNSDSIVEFYCQLAEKFKSKGASGVHIFVLGDSNLATRLIDNVKKQITNDKLQSPKMLG